VIYSDGLTEAENQADEMFGEKRLLQTIRQTGASGGRAVKEKLLLALEEFTMGVSQTDDITFVIVEKTV
jgi:sigma-B regulation protein RsbU (phosphoserine phosphatase)